MRIFLTTLVLLCFISTHSMSQDLEASASEIFVWEEFEDENQELTYTIDITNISPNSLEVKVKRNIVCEPDSSANRFCWAGLCYSESTEESPLSQTIAPGETVLGGEVENELEEFGFTAYYSANSGLSKLMYTFFEVGNPDNNVSVIVSYCLGTDEECQSLSAECEDVLGVDELNSTAELKASPNPASGAAFISYHLAGSLESTNLIIRDALGRLIKTVPIETSVGIIALDVSDLDQGTYFYSLSKNSTHLVTERLVVR